MYAVGYACYVHVYLPLFPCFPVDPVCGSSLRDATSRDESFCYYMLLIALLYLYVVLFLFCSPLLSILLFRTPFASRYNFSDKVDSGPREIGERKLSRRDSWSETQRFTQPRTTNDQQAVDNNNQKRWPTVRSAPTSVFSLQQRASAARVSASILVSRRRRHHHPSCQRFFLHPSDERR